MPVRPKKAVPRKLALAPLSETEVRRIVRAIVQPLIAAKGRCQEGHQELARFSAIQGRTWNIPAIDNGLLFVRNTTQMACFRLGKSAQ